MMGPHAAEREVVKMASVSAISQPHLRAVWAPSESDELLRLAIQVGGIGIFESDLIQKRTRFSPELCAILGMPVGTEMPYEEASRLFDERDRAAVQANAEVAAKSADRGKWNGVYRVVHADGAARWVSVHGRRLYRDTGHGLEPVRSMGVVIDITHLKETEEALRESELRLRFALEAAQMGTFEADLSGSQVIIDAQEARLLDLPEDVRVVSADELRKRIPFEDLNASDEKKQRLTEHREPYHHELRFRRRDGSERWLSAFADVRSNRIFGVNFDITQRKRAEAILREGEARLRVATSGAALGVFEWDAETDRAVWENDRMYEIFGRTRADGPLSKQQFVDSYLHRGDARDFEATLQEALRTGGDFQTICRIRRTDGTRRWLQIDGRFDTSEQLRFIGVVADITARKTLERKAKQLAERVMSIQEEERRTIAQELHDSTVQHLVAASLSLMSLRPSSRLCKKEQRHLDDVETSIGEAAKELRTFSYLMHPPALRRGELYATMQQYVDGLGHRSGLDIELTLDRKVDRLPFRLQQSLFRIVQAALANVYRHASASRVEVELRSSSGRLHVAITDNGCGMKRGSGQEWRPLLRPGIGLRSIRARVQDMGGLLKITRVRPHGTRIHATVPISYSSDGPPLRVVQP
jgi:PAS domain S-box-containing protein